jgi:hypothetical protein
VPVKSSFVKLPPTYRLASPWRNASPSVSLLASPFLDATHGPSFSLFPLLLFHHHANSQHLGHPQHVLNYNELTLVQQTTPDTECRWKLVSEWPPPHHLSWSTRKNHYCCWCGWRSQPDTCRLRGKYRAVSRSGTTQQLHSLSFPQLQVTFSTAHS